jgi:cell division protein FtsI/penicillin-binding protein 2
MTPWGASASADAASPLRPASAFVMIGCVLALVGAWVSRTVVSGGERRRPWTREESSPDPEYSIHDRDGRPLALFVEQLALVMSPNAMWQAHTPVYMAERLAEVLGLDPQALLAALLPDAVDGIIEVDLDLDETQAHRVQRWADLGELDGDERGAGPVAGLWVQWNPARSAFRLHWAPEVTLSPEARKPHGCEGNPLRWGRLLADGLARCIEGPLFQAHPSGQELIERRAAVWELLMPSTFAEVLEDLPAERAPELLALLDREAVAHHQMSVQRGRERFYPAGELALLGGWGFLDAAQAEGQVLAERGVADSGSGAFERYRALLPEDQRPELEAELRAALARPQPLYGLERACDELLDGPGWNAFLERRPASYSFLRHRPVHQRARSYYIDSVPASESPRVATTLDLPLQDYVGAVLDELMEDHQPALAMAIVVEVASGGVLAVESRQAYGYSGFAPVFHEFTPGSTFKPLVMASALEAGVVRPEDTFDVGSARAYPIGGGRVIHEAESSKTGILTASECLAHSVNAGMVQIGLRVDDDVLRADFTALGYGRAPGSGLGGERDGYLTPLPWVETQTKASVCFGHELSVTLWQHAAALNALVRGGEYVPLRLLDGVEQNGLYYELVPAEQRRVYSTDTCLAVREMMKLAAREGTGARIASPEVLPGIVVGTKTGTPQKVPTEACLHVELGHYERHRRAGTDCNRTCRRSIASEPMPHRTCYSPVMCAFGRLEESEREVLVLVIADDPLTGKFGGDVAGPPAIAILREALGQTRAGLEPVPDLVEGFAPSSLAGELSGSGPQPWTEVGW